MVFFFNNLAPAAPNPVLAGLTTPIRDIEFRLAGEAAAAQERDLSHLPQLPFVLDKLFRRLCIALNFPETGLAQFLRWTFHAFEVEVAQILNVTFGAVAFQGV